MFTSVKGKGGSKWTEKDRAVRRLSVARRDKRFMSLTACPDTLMLKERSFLAYFLGIVFSKMTLEIFLLSEDECTNGWMNDVDYVVQC